MWRYLRTGMCFGVLVARSIGLPAAGGQHFLLDTGTLSRIGLLSGNSGRQDVEQPGHGLMSGRDASVTAAAFAAGASTSRVPIARSEDR